MAWTATPKTSLHIIAEQTYKDDKLCENDPSSAITTGGWRDLGRILDPGDFGRPAGTIIGDPTGVLLPSGIYTATSEDGLKFETSKHVGIPGGNPNVIVRADGVRLMYLSASDAVRGPGIRLVMLY